MSKKISELTAAGTLDGTELIEAVQGGASVQTTAQAIADLAGITIKKYVATLTQTATDAPIATVIVNTLSGTPVWSYNSAGQYLLTLPGEFLSTKTIAFANVACDSSSSVYLTIGRVSDDVVGLRSTYQLDGSSVNIETDGDEVSIEITVYP